MSDFLEFRMYRIFSFLAIVALSVALFVEHWQLVALSERLDDGLDRIESMEMTMARDSDATGLFYRFIVNNHRSIQELRRSRVLTVTAYSPREAETDDSPFHTASNRPVRQGIVAVSRDLFDAGWVFGKKVYIKNYGVFTIDDLMAVDKRNQMDIFMFDTRAALDFGRKQLEVHLIDL